MAFIASFLAFGLELSAAKLLLPRFGGSAYVWTGAMMFYQALLLLAYLYARKAPLYPRFHGAVLAAGFLFLPLTLPAAHTANSPFAGLLWALLGSVGMPFFALSTTVVVAQRWLMNSSLPDRKDGFFLYAASNAGAACALLAYPFIVEPLLSESAEGWLWRGLYAAQLALCYVCAERVPATRVDAGNVSARQRALWLLLSAGPCAALLATTHLLSMDFAAVPLLWILPLAVYLLTLVLNFKRHPWYPEKLDRTLLPIAAAMAALYVIPLALAYSRSGDTTPAQLLERALDYGKFAYLHFALFALGMVLHRALAAARPAAEGAMAGYYGWMAAGGLFGSALVGIAVPVIGRNVGATALDWAAVGALALSGVLLRDWEQIAIYKRTAAGLTALGIALVGAVFAAGSRGGTLYNLRNFYGIYSVEDRDGVRWLFHGNTEHGMQYVHPDGQAEPLSYYGRTSPLAEAWYELGAGWNSVGVVGLGAGSISAYGRPGMAMDFFELDPDVVAIARDWFTHLHLSQANIRVLTGDGRLSLDRPGPAYDALILDAFSSGSVPVHLLTQEAFAVYLRRLKPGGIILLHASSRYIDLRPILAAAAHDLGLAGAAKRRLPTGNPEDGQTPSVWIALSRDPAAVETLVAKKGWRGFGAATARTAAWTDRHVSVLSALAY